MEQETWGRTFDASGKYTRYSTWHLADWAANGYTIAACGRSWSASSSQLTHERNRLHEVKANPAMYVAAQRICKTCLRKALAHYGPARPFIAG